MHIERVVKQVDFVLKPYCCLRGEAFAIIFPKSLDNFHIILYNKDKEKKL